MVIYEIVNVINGKRYIGQTVQQATRRWTEHRYRLSVGTHDNAHLQNAWNKYGKTAFTFNIIDVANSIEELNKKEQLLIGHHKSTDKKFGYNIKSGGSNARHSDESKQKISSALRGRTHGKKTVIKRVLARRKEKYPLVISPNGKAFEVLDVTNFCRTHGLQPTGMFEVINKTARHYKGWRLQGTDLTQSTGNVIASKLRPHGYPSLLSPDGTVYSEIKNLRQFCVDHMLTPSNLSAVIHKKAKSHKGWSLAE